MFLESLATAVPPRLFTQDECYRISQAPEVRSRLNRRSQLIVQSVLRGDSGVNERHFAVTDVPGVFNYSADQLNEAFRREAPKLASEALARAMAPLGIQPQEIDALLVCTCTGYLCPGLTSYVAEQLGLRTDVILHDLAGLGCGAAIPMLRTADALLRADAKARIATVAVEVCSAAFYLDDDPGVLISACLFGDGAAAALWRSDPTSIGLRCRDFSTLHKPAERDKIRFEHREGKLRNLLHASVPRLAADAVTRLFAEERRRASSAPIGRIVAHPGGRDVIVALENALPGFSFEAGRKVLRNHGNMSSPSVLFVLEECLRSSRPRADEDWWIVSFGAGFSAHGCRLGV
ncbi:stilbene synthase [Opitutaceae bacterium EW11]|nr:stilbene synthase [Opitutaceae bacterium EW11]